MFFKPFERLTLFNASSYFDRLCIIHNYHSSQKIEFRKLPEHHQIREKLRPGSGAPSMFVRSPAARSEPSCSRWQEQNGLMLSNLDFRFGMYHHLQIMLLTLNDEFLKIVFLRGIVTSEIFDREKRKSRLGIKNCPIVKKFVGAVREDYRDFFPRKPCNHRLNRLAHSLFRNSGKSKLIKCDIFHK